MLLFTILFVIFQYFHSVHSTKVLKTLFSSRDEDIERQSYEGIERPLKDISIPSSVF